MSRRASLSSLGYSMLEHSGQNLKVTCSVCFLGPASEGLGELGEDILPVLVLIDSAVGVAVGKVGGSCVVDKWEVEKCAPFWQMDGAVARWCRGCERVWAVLTSGG